MVDACMRKQLVCLVCCVCVGALCKRTQTTMNLDKHFIIKIA